MLSKGIKGGQLSLHALRMFQQVISIMLIWAMIVAIATFMLIVCVSTTTRQWITATDYCLANVMNEVGLSKAPIRTIYHGAEYKLDAKTIKDSSYHQTNAEELVASLQWAGWVSAMTSCVVLVLIAGYFIHRGIEKSADKFQRGVEPRNFNSVRWAIRTFNRKQKYDAYVIAGAPYPARTEMQHTMLIGTTGTGKTSVISDVVEQIRRRGDRAIIYDTKGCYLEWFYRQETDHILNPFDKRSEQWNLLKEIGHVGHIKSIAQAFIPDGTGSSTIWNEAARIAFSGAIEKLMCDDLTNRDIANLLMKQDVNDIVKFLKGTYAQSIIGTKAPETTGGVLFTMSTYLNNLRLMNAKRAESFSIKEWAREAGDSFLFITSHQESAAELVPLQTVWWEIVFKSLLSGERNTGQKTWVILDEIGSLQKIPSLQETLSKTREYGCPFVLGMQDIGQLEHRYGDRHARTISTLCNTRCVFRTPDPHTANWISKNIGEQELEQMKEGLSYGAHQMRDGVSVSSYNVVKPLVMPSEIQNLKNLEMYLQLPNYPFVKTSIDWKDREIKSKAFVENEALIEELRTNNAEKPSATASQASVKSAKPVSADQSAGLSQKASQPHRTAMAAWRKGGSKPVKPTKTTTEPKKEPAHEF